MSRRKTKPSKHDSAAIIEQLNAPYGEPLPPAHEPNVVDAIEFGRLGAELKQLCARKYDELIIAMRKIVDAQRILNGDGRPVGAWEIEDNIDGERPVN